MADITVRQLLDLAATENLKLNLYDEVHQRNMSCTEGAISSKSVCPYDWGSATVTYWNPVSYDEIDIECVLKPTPALQLAAIHAKLLDVLETLCLVRDSYHETDYLNTLLDILGVASAEVEGRANDPNINKEFGCQSAGIWLNEDVTDMLHDIMITCNEEDIREADAGLVDILNIECIEVLKLIREWKELTI